MNRRPTRSKRTATLFPYTALFGAGWRTVSSSRPANAATRASRVAMSSLWKPGMREFLASVLTVVCPGVDREGRVSMGHQARQPGDQPREGRAYQQGQHLQQHEGRHAAVDRADRKSTRLNSSH